MRKTRFVNNNMSEEHKLCRCCLECEGDMNYTFEHHQKIQNLLNIEVSLKLFNEF